MAGFSKQKSYDKVDLDVNDDINELHPSNVASTNGNFASFTFKKAQKAQQNNFLGMSRLRKAPAPPPPPHSAASSSPSQPSITAKKSNPTIISTTKKINQTNIPTTKKTVPTKITGTNTESKPKPNVNNESHTNNDNNTNNTKLNITDDKDTKQDVASPSMVPAQPSTGVPRNTSQPVLNKGNRSRRRAMFIDLTQISDGLDPNATADDPSKVAPPSPSTEAQNSEKVLSPKITVIATEPDHEKVNDAEEEEEGSTDEGGGALLSEDKKSSSKEQLFSAKVPKLSLRRKATKSIPQVKSPTLVVQAMQQQGQQGQQNQQTPVSPHTPKGRSDGFSVVMPEDFYDKILEAKYNEVVVDKENDIVKVEGVSKIPQSESLDNVNNYKYKYVIIFSIIILILIF